MYKKTFIRQVIARVDFAAPLESVEKEVLSGFSKFAQKRFPIIVPKQVISIQGPTAGAPSSLTMWEYQDRKRENKLELLSTHMDVNFKKYTSYLEDLKNTFVGLSDALTKECPSLAYRRFGLRFINVVAIDDRSAPTKWEKYLNSDLISGLRIPLKPDDILRSFGILIYRSEDVLVNFRYGMINPDYPAPIKKKEFVLDYDAYYEGLIEGREIPELMDLFHKKVYELFESCITNTTRRMMGSSNGRRKRR